VSDYINFQNLVACPLTFDTRIVRLNPDVLIRDDRWLLEQMTNPKIDAIFRPYDMGVWYQGAIHSDFYAFRPIIYDRLTFPEKKLRRLVQYSGTAEVALYRLFGHLLTPDQECKTSLLSPYNCTDEQRDDTIVDPTSRVAIIPHIRLHESDARVLGTESPLLHIHNMSKFCPYYFNVTDGVEY
jgi:hypothetical protein